MKDAGMKLTSKKLVDNTVRSSTSVALRTTTRLGNRVQLVEKDNARCCGTGLVENVTNVALRLTEPHGKQLRTLDGDEVGSTLVGDGLSTLR